MNFSKGLLRTSLNRPSITGLVATVALSAAGLFTTLTLTVATVAAAPPAKAVPVPGPLPLLGAGAAFGWSRRLRRRVSAARTR